MDFRQPKPETQELLRQIWSKPPVLDRFRHKPDHRPPPIRQIAEGGDIAALPFVFELVFDKSSEVAETAMECVHRLLSNTPVHALPVLEENVRRYSYFLDKWRDWNWLQPAHVAILPKHSVFGSSLLGVMSFHPSGFVREAAVRELDRIEYGSELPFLLLRANDWVEPVRNLAKSAIQRRLRPSYFEDFASNAHLVLRLAESGRDRHDDLIRWFMDQLIDSQHETVLLELLQGHNRWLKRMCFQRALDVDSERRKSLVLLGLRANDVVVRFEAARQARLSFASDELNAALQLMEADHFMPVRREALLARIERYPDNAADILDKALFDQHSSIRELARFHLKKIGRTEFAADYRKAVTTRPLIGLMGLSEAGSADDVKLALPFLLHPGVALRLAAISLVVNFGGDGCTEELLTGLQDDSKKVTLAAKRGLQAHCADLSPERLCGISQNDPRQHVQLAAAEVLDKTGSWRAVPYLLRLCVQPNEQLASRAMALIGRRINRVFTSPNPEDCQLIRATIDEYAGRFPQPFLGELQKWLAGRT
jgi:HEAT repeat protein